MRQRVGRSPDLRSSTEDIDRTIKNNITPEVIRAKLNSLKSRREIVSTLSILYGMQSLSSESHKYIEDKIMDLSGMKRKELRSRFSKYLASTVL